MRIYKNRQYILAVIPGISGFQRWDEREYYVVSGLKAKNNRVDIIAEWTPCADEQYELCDGHLPGYRPVGGILEVLAFLEREPYQMCLAVGATADRYHARYYHALKAAI